MHDLSNLLLDFWIFLISLFLEEFLKYRNTEVFLVSFRCCLKFLEKWIERIQVISKWNFGIVWHCFLSLRYRDFLVWYVELLKIESSEWISSSFEKFPSIDIIYVEYRNVNVNVRQDVEYKIEKFDDETLRYETRGNMNACR